MAFTMGDVHAVQKAIDKLESIDPAALALSPLILAPVGSKLYIAVPWLDGDMTVMLPPPVDRIYGSPGATLARMLENACEAGLEIELVTRAGKSDASDAVASRLKAISRLNSGRCLKLSLRESIHSKVLKLEGKEILLEILTSANLTAPEIWKTRTGDNFVKAQVKPISQKSN
jgi:hypothetical protein